MRLMKLGALADADLGIATQRVAALSQRRLDLQRTLIEAQRSGVAVPAQLTHAIMGLDAEWDALNTSIDAISHTELPHWLAQAQALDTEMAGLESQLALTTGASTTHTATMLVVGGIAALAIAGGLAWYVRSKSGSKRAPGLFGTPAEHAAKAREYISDADHWATRIGGAHGATSYRTSTARDYLVRAKTEALWAEPTTQSTLLAEISKRARQWSAR